MKFFKNKYSSIYLLISLLFLNTTCQDNPASEERDLIESLESIEEVYAVEGGEGTTTKVKKDSATFLNVGFSEIGSNDIIQNGVKEAWCLDWDTYINPNSGIYRDVPLYSTYHVEEWMRINYLLNIQEELQGNDSEITYLEIQLAIWTLRKVRSLI